MTFQLRAKIKVKKKPKDSVRTETIKKKESTNKTKIKNKEGPESSGKRMIIMRLGEKGKREEEEAEVSGVWTQRAEKTICVTLSMMTSLSLATKIITEAIEMEEDNKEGAEEIEGEVMEEEIEVDHHWKEGQVIVVTREAAISTIEEEMVATTDLWIIIMAHLTE